MFKKLKEMIQGSGDEELIAKILDSSEPDLRSIGLFAELEAEKIAEICHAMLYLNEMNNVAAGPSLERPIHFYISTYGGNADDMFALYDLMRIIREETEIHTIGLGKVMSAGVLILAAGTKGKRYIGRNCRVMLHAVMGGNQGSLHDMMNEMDAIEQLQQMYIECLVKETKMTESTIKKMLERKINIYLSAEEAVEHGIADYIV